MPDYAPFFLLPCFVSENWLRCIYFNYRQLKQSRRAGLRAGWPRGCERDIILEERRVALVTTDVSEEPSACLYHLGDSGR
jgi:hypothetical protein